MTASGAAGQPRASDASPARDQTTTGLPATADVVVIGAGVQGASLAFHLARRGVRVAVLDRGTAAGAATGRSSGFVRMHYDIESEARLAWASFPYFLRWADIVGSGDCGFVRTGFVQLVAEGLVPNLRANVAMHRGMGIETEVIGPDDLAALMPGIRIDDVVAAAYEPGSGYADPAGTTLGFLGAARALGARVGQGCRVTGILQSESRVTGVATDRGPIAAPVVVDVAGAWAAEIAGMVGLEIPVQAWRHETAYFGLPDGRGSDFPIVIDDITNVYFRPEGRALMLVGLETNNEIGGSPDRPMVALGEDAPELMSSLVCARVPWMEAGTFRTFHGGQDGMTPDQHAILGRAGPEGFHLACGFSGTGFKTAPAIGLAMAELIVDGRATTVDITDFALERFAVGRPLVGRHPYGHLWR